MLLYYPNSVLSVVLGKILKFRIYILIITTLVVFLDRIILPIPRHQLRYLLTGRFEILNFRACYVAEKNHRCWFFRSFFFRFFPLDSPDVSFFPLFCLCKFGALTHKYGGV